jgi:hypothetical protein
LTSRGVVDVRGEDRDRFLQGLVTGNVTLLGKGAPAIAAGLLTPQGKILFEMIVVGAGDSILLDVPRGTAADLVRRLGFYKLRAKVEISDRSGELGVRVESARRDGVEAFADPRHDLLGFRALLPAAPDPADAAETAYHRHRIACGVPELGQDYRPGEVYPHEALYDQTGAVDFKKGCYVGQEVVSRMEHRGTARSRFVIVEGNADLPPRGVEVVAGETSLGTMGSSVGRSGLALLRLDRLAQAKAPIEAAGVKLTVRKPPFGRFDVPGSAP